VRACVCVHACVCIVCIAVFFYVVFIMTLRRMPCSDHIEKVTRIWQKLLCMLQTCPDTTSYAVSTFCSLASWRFSSCWCGVSWC